MSLNILMISDEMIKERTVIHGNIDPKLIYPDIKVSQDMYVHPILGSALYNRLQSAIADGSIGSPAMINYKALLDNFISDCLIYYTLAALPTTISFQFWNKGIVRKQGENTELPSMSELIDLSNSYKARAEFYANRLRLYLKQKANEYFPEYNNPGNGVDDMRPERKSFTLPIYLDEDDDDCGLSYEQRYQ